MNKRTLWMLVLTLLAAFSLLAPAALAQDTLAETLIVQDWGFLMRYPADYTAYESDGVYLIEPNSGNADLPNFGVIYLGETDYEGFGGNLDDFMAFVAGQDGFLPIDSDPEALSVDGNDALQLQGTVSGVDDGFAAVIGIESPGGGVLLVLGSLLASDSSPLFTLFDTMISSIQLTAPGEIPEGDTPVVDAVPLLPVRYEMTETLEIFGITLSYPTGWVAEELSPEVVVIYEEGLDLNTDIPESPLAGILYLAPDAYEGSARLFEDLLGLDFLPSQRAIEQLTADGAAVLRRNGVSGDRLTYQSVSVLELPDGDAIVIFVVTNLRQKLNAIGLSNGLLENIQLGTGRTDLPSGSAAFGVPGDSNQRWLLRLLQQELIARLRNN